MYKPTECAVVFDGAGAKAVKQKIYAGYKASRASSLDDNLHQQFVVVKSLLCAAGIYVLHKDQVDADDAIGALASLRHDRSQPRSVLIQSNDKDFGSLTDPRCSTIRNRGMGPEIWTQAEFEAHFGVKSNQIADYLALCGDSVDGIPGLYKCGPVAAQELLGRYRSVEEIVSSWKTLDEPWRGRVKKQAKELLAFKKLTTLDETIIPKDALRKVIVPKLTPQPYERNLQELCLQNGLVWVNNWFQAHPQRVVASIKGLWA
jgi:5'-3' exonuclease